MPRDLTLADSSDFYTCKNPDDYVLDYKAFYDQALERRSALNTDIIRIKYGAAADNIANVHRPDGAVNAPVVLFFHGGRWREGHPDFYDFLAAPWVARGAVFINCGYRLMPRYSITDIIDDAVAATAWARENCHDFGGSSALLTLAGHSAGGHMAAMAALTDWRGSTSTPDLAGLICVSTPVDVGDRFPGYPSPNALSPARRVVKTPRSTVISFGSPETNRKNEDRSFYAEQGRLLHRALLEAGGKTSMVELGDTNHIATAEAFADPTSPLFKAAEAVVFPRP
ncbi:arylformamidase [Paenarthrobacter nicotinovorans]|uniref:alpha/beta hydrolase n=1 Tax=Paenarthrobacter nicotinovorans TaxID=29320 RepID=UPI00278334E6|nr:alpha/beta hydrolase [Paenarthrobacter nicotinovorans]MDP9936901.1 arylformamidase [Paenarthrobacter nicotinovorans]